MPYVDALQSAVMYRTGKLFHGCAGLFVFFPLLIYVVSTTFVLAVEGARDLPNQREIKEAQKIVGRFLRNDAGTSWLSGLAKTKSAPLTSEDLMDAIRRTTKKGDKVWEAASIIKEAIKFQNVEDMRPDSFLGQNENWKNIIADIEKEDDIICLYRKNTEQTAKKAEDWQKFLKTVSPGYTVHLAIDTGLQYVICLKKIEVPEAEPIEIPPSREILSTPSSPEFHLEITSETPALYPKTPLPSAMIGPTARKLHRSNEQTNSRYERSDESCENEESEEAGIDNEEDEYDEDERDNDDDYGNDDSFEDRRMRKRMKHRMHHVLGNEWRDDLVHSRKSTQSPYSFPIGSKTLSLNNYDQQSYSPWSADGRLLNEPFKKNPECDRPIILVVQDRNSPSGYRPVFSPMFPAQLSELPRYSNFYSRLPLQSSALPRSPLNHFVSSKNFPRLMELNNWRKPIRSYSSSPYPRDTQPDLSRNWKSAYKTSLGTMPIVNRAEKPIVQIRKGKFVPMLPNREYRGSQFVPMLPNRESRGSQFIHQQPNVIPPSLRDANYSPRRFERPNIRNTAIPMSRSTALSKWQEKERWRNVVNPRGKAPDQRNFVGPNPLSQLEQQRKEDFLRQSMSKRLNSRLAPKLPVSKPIFAPIASKPMQRPIVQPFQPSTYSKPFVQESSNLNQRLRASSLQNSNQMSTLNCLQLPQNIRRVSCMRIKPNANYPTANNLVDQRQRKFKDWIPTVQRPVLSNPFSFDTPNRFSPIRHNDLYTENSRGQAQLRQYPETFTNCCDRPVKLQIVIDGKVQDPSKVTVLTEPRQRLEIVGSRYPVMPYGFRRDMSEPSMRAAFEEAEGDEGPQVVEVEQRMNALEDKTKRAKVSKVSKMENSIYDEEDETEEKEERYETAIENTSIDSEKMKNEETSTLTSQTETMSAKKINESAEVTEVSMRFFDEITTEPTSTVVKNVSLSTTTNFTLIA